MYGPYLRSDARPIDRRSNKGGHFYDQRFSYRRDGRCSAREAAFVIAPGKRYPFAMAKASRAAASVCSMSSSVWADDRNIASNADGAT